VTKKELYKIVEILRNQLREEQSLRMNCIDEMIEMYNSLPESDKAERLRKILESPGEAV
jgi:hypothetical protein